MKNRKLRIVGIIMVVAMVFGLMACTSEADDSSRDSTEQGLESLANDFEKGPLIKEHTFDDGRLTLVTMYSTDYKTKEWKITKAKTLNFGASLKRGPGGEGALVYVEHVHVDVTLWADSGSLGGIKQDSMDNSLHSGTEPGFSISDGYPYQGVFSVEGYSQTLIDGWGYQTRDWGKSEITEVQLTEGALVDEGVDGNKFTFIWDLLVKYPGDTGFHKVAISSELVVPVGPKQT
jgi:hypothetical protein